ncbi:MAG: tripartite tricarboxylate transporter TctB family protein [Pseudomonadota bacterium]
MSDPQEEGPAEEPGGFRPGAALFTAVFLLLSLILLTQLGSETKFSGVEKLYEMGTLFNKGAVFKEPAFWPAVGVIGMCLFGGALIWTKRRAIWTAEFREGAFWLRPLEYLIWFMAYVFAAPMIGYLAATMLFMVLLALRAGYRQPVILGAAAGTGLAIVLIFKTFLAVKIPGGAVYEALPSGLRTFMIVNF